MYFANLWLLHIFMVPKRGYKTFLMLSRVLDASYIGILFTLYEDADASLVPSKHYTDWIINIINKK